MSAEPGSTYERWHELTTAAREVKTILMETSRMVWKLINSLESAADEIKVEAMDEKSAGDVPTRKQIKYNAPTGRIDSTKPNISQVGAPITSEFETAVHREFEPPRSANGRKRRTCSLCHQPGHWASTCPEAHKIYAARRLASGPTELKAAKPKRTVSPAQRAKLAENLKKARAAKKRTA